MDNSTKYFKKIIELQKEQLELTKSLLNLLHKVYNLETQSTDADKETNEIPIEKWLASQLELDVD